MTLSHINHRAKIIGLTMALAATTQPAKASFWCTAAGIEAGLGCEAVVFGLGGLATLGCGALFAASPPLGVFCEGMVLYGGTLGTDFCIEYGKSVAADCENGC